MVAGALEATQMPDLAAQVYQMVGLPPVAGMATQSGQTSVYNIQPGDIVGWHGGHQADGQYIGNLAVYAGQGEIIETMFGQPRRRKLNPNENTFGIPVMLPGDDQTDSLGGVESLPGHPVVP
jgi:hypothetical protein